jgi:tetratricopeptide (TPR) repeat protein
MMQEGRIAAAGRKRNSATPAKPGPQPGTGPAFNQYQSAVQLLQQAKYDKALAAFEKLTLTAPPELQERCRMYISTCQRQLERPALDFATPEERFDYAVSQLNIGLYEEAREQFNSVVSGFPAADYAYYGLAVLECMTNHPAECLANLSRAIDLNPRNRLQARTDNDFQSMLDDPRFTELLYPEVP